MEGCKADNKYLLGFVMIKLVLSFRTLQSEPLSCGETCESVCVGVAVSCFGIST